MRKTHEELLAQESPKFDLKEMGMLLGSVNTRTNIMEERSRNNPAYAAQVKEELNILQQLQLKLYEWFGDD